MDISFRGPPQFWESIIAMAETALGGGTDYYGVQMADDPGATSDLKITFIGDPVGDGIGVIYIPSDEDIENATNPWMEISDRVAAANGDA